ncbi:unnamed protein product [Lactuca saligna]|uniref:Uncharacterized protein n=1 Tax=Lactuca saligna TaxID=75948 RepID=A0AA35ZX39_LACSI|nr:unnamed protein product [Lactuca saligna]
MDEGIVELRCSSGINPVPWLPTRISVVSSDHSDRYIDITGEEVQKKRKRKHSATRKDATVESNIEETSIPDVNVNASNADTNISTSEPIITSLPEKIGATPYEGQESPPTDEDETIGFAELEFNHEEDIDDNMIMSGKQYMILNSKLKAID